MLRTTPQQRAMQGQRRTVHVSGDVRITLTITDESGKSQTIQGWKSEILRDYGQSCTIL